MRIIKEAEERKSEILDVAENLFITRGYELTTVNDILGATGIAKGTFYYHFKSKEEVLDGIIRRRGDANIQAAKDAAASERLSAPEKLLKIMLTQKPGDERQEKLISALEAAENSRMFVKSLTDIIQRLVPIVGEIIKQGVTEGAFSTSYPKESAEILLAAAHALFDNPYLYRENEDSRRMAIAFLTAAERILGANPGALSGMAILFERESSPGSNGR
jgi:AcrR family transcriptional regulator